MGAQPTCAAVADQCRSDDWYLAGNEGTRSARQDRTARGDYRGDIEAVRAANTEDPHRKIYDGRPAVTPAAA